MKVNIQERSNTRDISQQEHPYNLLQNLAIKQFEFNTHNTGRMNKIKYLQPTLPNTIFTNGYNKLKIMNSRMLPGIPSKHTQQSQAKQQHKNNKNLGSIRKKIHNTDILNSIIQILQNDTDRNTRSQTKKKKIIRLPSQVNQFIQCKEVASVRNQRGPKLIANQIMMLSHRKRDLVSSQKIRPKQLKQISYSMKKPTYKTIDSIQDIQLALSSNTKILGIPHSTDISPNSRLNQICSRINQDNYFRKY